MKRIGLSLVILLSWQASALAHIHLVTPISHTDQLTGDQKTMHCGDATAYDRAAHPERVTTYKPGETITVTWMETINHTGHYRISFQPDGIGFSIPPKSLLNATGYPDVDMTGTTDATTGAMVLADMVLDGTLTKQITLPNMECANCTLQFIQVMTDGGQYILPGGGAGMNGSLYFSCADIILSNTAPPPAPTPDGGVPASGDAGTGENDPNGPSATSGGCSTTSTGTSALFGLALLAGLRRRRR